MLRPMLFFAGAAVGAVALAAVMASLTVMMRDTPPEREPIPVLSELPSFELTSQAEQVVTRDDLRGKVWVANFIFTRCPSICPIVTGRTVELQTMLQTHAQWDDIRLVSFSVDPAHDTPAVLREYGQRYDADPDHWLFLTGERERIWRLIEDGFLLAVEDAPEDSEMPILHSDKFVLVDRLGRIRGYYSATDQADRAKLLTDLHTVVTETATDEPPTGESPADAGSPTTTDTARR